MPLLFPFLRSLDLQLKWIVPFNGGPKVGRRNSEPLKRKNAQRSAAYAVAAPAYLWRDHLLKLCARNAEPHRLVVRNRIYVSEWFPLQPRGERISIKHSGLEGVDATVEPPRESEAQFE